MRAVANLMRTSRRFRGLVLGCGAAESLLLEAYWRHTDAIEMVMNGESKTVEYRLDRCRLTDGFATYMLGFIVTDICVRDVELAFRIGFPPHLRLGSLCVKFRGKQDSGYAERVGPCDLIVDFVATSEKRLFVNVHALCRA